MTEVNLLMRKEIHKKINIAHGFGKRKTSSVLEVAEPDGQWEPGAVPLSQPHGCGAAAVPSP